MAAAPLALGGPGGGLSGHTPRTQPLPVEPDASTSDADLTISVLGPLRALRAGELLTLGGPRQRAVLARLVIAPGQVVAAERLIDDLWAGEPPASASSTLQSYVSNLRRALGGDGGPVIEREAEGYRLAPGAATSLSARFDQLVALATDRAGSASAAERAALLEEGLGLWHGTALADFAGEAWARSEAGRLDELRMAATEARFDLLLGLGRHALIVGELAAAVAAHPLRERLAEQLVLALYRCGRQPEALAAYERTREHLGENLGLDPGPDLVRLAEAVERRDPSLDLEGTSASSPATPPADRPTGTLEPTAVLLPNQPLTLPPAVTERRVRSTFVGRADELGALDGSLQRVLAGDRRLVTIAGEAGIGKTRIAQVFAQQVHEAGGHVLWGRCTVENLIAYQPAVEAFRTALRSISPKRVQSIVAPRPALGLLLPDEPTGPGEVTAAPSGRSERYELHEALADVIGQISVTGPVTFVVDDAQWADRSTLSLLDHLVRHDRTGRLLIVATIRRPAGRPTDDLDQLLAGLRRAGRLDEVDIEGMAAADIAELVGAQGVELSPEAARTIRERTGGNPFFVESLAERGGDLLQLDDRVLPESAKDVIDLRLADLTPETTRVLTAGAVIGLRIDLDVLGRVTGLSPDDLLDELDVAIEAGLLAEDEDIGWVTFPHALVRQALVARTTRNREAQLNLQVADALEQSPHALDQAIPVAQHLLQAGRLCPPERLAAACTAAGHRALAMLADEDARDWGVRAVEALDAAPTSPDLWKLHADASLLAGRAHRHLGDLDAAMRALTATIDDARAHADPVRFAEAVRERALVLGGVGFAFGNVDEELLELLDEAVKVLEAADGLEHEQRSALFAALLAWASIARNSTPDKDFQIDLADLAMAYAEQVERRPDLRALAGLALRIAHAEPAGLALRQELGPPMVASAIEAGWTELVVVGMVLDVVDLLEAGRFAAAKARVDDIGEYIAPFNRPMFDAYHLFLGAAMAQMVGRHEEAEALSARADELGEISHADNARHARVGQQFVLARDLGMVGDIAPLTGAMVEAYPTFPVWLTGHATATAAAGDLESTSAAIAQLFAVDGLNQRDSTWSTSVAQLAEVCWMLQDAEHCRILADLLEPIADHMAVTGMGAVCLGYLHRSHGLALAGAGDLDGAIEALTLAIERSEADGIELWLARSLGERALISRQRGAAGDEEIAARDMPRALEIAERLGVRLALGTDEYA